MRGLIQRVNVDWFNPLCAQDVAKELELSQDSRRQQRACASEIVILSFEALSRRLIEFDVQL